MQLRPDGSDENADSPETSLEPFEMKSNADLLVGDQSLNCKSQDSWVSQLSDRWVNFLEWTPRERSTHRVGMISANYRDTLLEKVHHLNLQIKKMKLCWTPERTNFSQDNPYSYQLTFQTDPSRTSRLCVNTLSHCFHHFFPGKNS